MSYVSNILHHCASTRAADTPRRGRWAPQPFPCGSAVRAALAKGSSPRKESREQADSAAAPAAARGDLETTPSSHAALALQGRGERSAVLQSELAEPQRLWSRRSPGVTEAAQRCKPLLTVLTLSLPRPGITALHPDRAALTSPQGGWQRRLCPASPPRSTSCPVLSLLPQPGSWEGCGKRTAEQVPHSHVHRLKL